mgnify:CR=1 FL=1
MLCPFVVVWLCGGFVVLRCGVNTPFVRAIICWPECSQRLMSIPLFSSCVLRSMTGERFESRMKALIDVGLDNGVPVSALLAKMMAGGGGSGGTGGSGGSGGGGGGGGGGGWGAGGGV